MQALSIFKEFSHTKIKDPYHTLKYALALCSAEIYFAYTLIYLSAVDFKVIANNYSIDFDIDLAQGIFQGILPIGGSMGAVSSTFFISKLSRRYTYIYIRQVLFLFCFIGSLLCFLSLYPNYKIFLVVRLLQGFCSGLFSSVVPVIARQNSPIEMSSIIGSLPNLVIIFGLFFVYFFSFVLGSITGDMTGSSTWKIIFLFPLFFLAIHSYLMWKVYPYQTPKYLAQTNQVSELKQLLK